MAVETDSDSWLDAATALTYLRITVYTLTGLLGLTLLAVGTVGIIAELKGTWHWSIHFESTISYLGLFTSRLLAVLVPLFLLLVGSRRVIDDA